MRSAMKIVVTALAGLCALAGISAAGSVLWQLARGTTPPSVDVCLALGFAVLILAALSAGLFMFARQLERGPRKRAKVTDAKCHREHGSRCAECGDDDVVRGSQNGGWGGWSRQSRCLTCGARANVSRATWKSLPTPNTGDPFEAYQDRFELAKHSDLTLWSFACLAALTAAAGVLGWACASAAGSLWAKADRPEIFIIALWAGALRIWVRIFAPRRRPGRRCVRCAYDLRGCAERRCPECGTPFDPNVVGGSNDTTAAKSTDEQ